MSIVIRTASSPHDIESALRLRYAVFTEEGGDLRYANVADRTYRDGNDAGRSCIMVAVDGDRVVGTLRATFRADGPFIADALYRFPLILEDGAGHTPCGLETVVLFDRVAVHSGWRGQKIFLRMLDYASALANAAGCRKAVLAVATDNARMQHILGSQGWNSYPVVDSAGGWAARHFFQRIG